MQKLIDLSRSLTPLDLDGTLFRGWQKISDGTEASVKSRSIAAL
jgi:ribonucleotide monophosphatase NagD (HAD superfamily)